MLPQAIRARARVLRTILATSPAEVKRAVWSRDGGRGTFVGNDGRRCTEQGFLEFRHVMPYAAGGPSTPENIQLRCRAHNGYEAELSFGPRNALVARETRASYMHLTEQTRRRSPLDIPAATRPGSSTVSATLGCRQY